MLGWRCRASSMGGQDLLLLRLLPGHGRRRKPLLVAFLILTVFVLLLRPVVADEYTGYCRWVSQDDTLTNYEGVHEAYVSFDNTDQTAGWLSLYVDMSAGGDPSTREVYLCQSEYATVVQTYPNGSSPVSIPQSKVSVTYHSMSLCVSKAFNFMKDAGLIQRDTADLTYLLIALNETWY
ncbi:mitochondrial chaperone [Perkinsus chesapeaki]|uniref:Mitochondrial chaperone n=1 Tax=Perkinsus chesapeaki TaxID=330153 RepID=A0A7J6MVW8_PERCH|nr:mitochondrial chaperone [Perkinsus chesapeaki]